MQNPSVRSQGALAFLHSLVIQCAPALGQALFSVLTIEQLQDSNSLSLMASIMQEVVPPCKMGVYNRKLYCKDLF